MNEAMIIQTTLPIWNRDHEDGSYSAEPAGWKLHVTYTPEPPPPGGPFGFSWKATPAEGASGKERASTELLEEPEQAMMQAEQAIGLRDEKGVPVRKKDEEPVGQSAGLARPPPTPPVAAAGRGASTSPIPSLRRREGGRTMGSRCKQPPPSPL